MSNPSSTQQLQQLTQDAFEKAPSVYVNGFVNGMGITDTYLVFQTNGQTTMVMNMSLSLAKTLAQSLLNNLNRYEQQTGQKILTMEEITNNQ